MKKQLLTLLSLWSLTIGSVFEVQGQDVQDSTMYLIETTDGNEFMGYILGRDEVKITFYSEKFGSIDIPISLVNNIEKIDPDKLTEKGYMFENPQATRYFFAPNGYGLRKGEAYYQNLWIMYNQFSFGVTDNFSLGVGTVPVFLFGVQALPIWITPKFSIPIVENKVNLGIGVFAGKVISLEELSEALGIFYGTATFGSRDTNLSIGLGYGFAGENLSKTPIINVSGMVRTSTKTYFLTENYLLGGENTTIVLSMGGRSIIKRISLDYGGFIPLSEDMSRFLILPWLGINVPLGKKVVEIPMK
ncbi:MAG: hypothetical protein U5K79_21365 [Cyclobacteriaceae bacterium]|nr:hypothetical protein [Cyclobacteriaceae bacterium]